MSSTNRELIDRIHATLKNDPVLSEYVKSFTKGDMRTSRALFPFVSVGNLRYRIEPFTTADDIYIYTVDILCGTHSLVPGAALEGNEKINKKGILQLCEDVAAALRGSWLGNLISAPCTIISVSHGRPVGGGGQTHLCCVKIGAERFKLRKIG